MNNFNSPKDFFAEARDEAEVQSFLNNDLYKFLMLDFILNHPVYRDLFVDRKMNIRTKSIQTASVIPESSIKSQLDFARSINGVNSDELFYLASLKRPNWIPIFSDKFISFLKNLKLPEYRLWVDENWNYDLHFEWTWAETIMWEIVALKIVNSSYLYNYTKKAWITNTEFQSIVSQMRQRLFSDIEIFKSDKNLTFVEYWTRRSASTSWHKYVNEVLKENLPGQYIWTSNVLFARELWVNPKWTNAHELRMIPTALYDTKEEIVNAMYWVDREWAKFFPEYAVLLPDTYWSSFYFENCPDDVFQKHTWCRFDSKDPVEAILEYAKFVEERGGDIQKKIWMPSDWLEASIFRDIFEQTKWKVWIITSWIWTSLSNNSKNTFPKDKETFWPFWSFSVTVKPNRVKRPNWKWVSCVKLSDNPTKATWEKSRVELFKQIFWVEWFQNREVIV